MIVQINHISSHETEHLYLYLDSPAVQALDAVIITDTKSDKSAYLTCKVDSNPYSKVVWYHDDLLLDKVATVARNTSHHTLILEHVTNLDIGTYGCLASNNVGDGRGVVHLTGKPYR